MSLPDILVVGAGALGWACAEAATTAGAAVTLVDPGGSSASKVAAGMLAPAFESALDAAERPRADLYREARDLWPALADRRGLTLGRTGALWPGEGAEALYATLVALGFTAERRDGGVFTPEDWTVDPRSAFASLPAAVDPRAGRAVRVGPGWVELEAGERLQAGLVVLATGVAAVPGAAEPTLAAVSPIKGQIICASGVRSPPCVLRGPGVYVVPRAGGVLVGGTMEFGSTDPKPDSSVLDTLMAAGAALWPPFAEPVRVFIGAGVRGATPDGLPLVGPVAPGLAVALAPRRNGWLLAPLVGRMIAAYAAGADPGPHAAVLDPLRFQAI